MPQNERDFCAAITETAGAYDAAKKSGANELKLSALRTVRRGALLKAMHSRPAVKDWVGTIQKLSTTGDGKAAVKVELPCSATVATWNNSVSDMVGRTLIPQSSKLYGAFAELQKGAAIRFSGKLVTNEMDGFQEKSVTEAGSMTEPDFLFAFSGVSRQ